MAVLPFYVSPDFKDRADFEQDIEDKKTCWAYAPGIGAEQPPLFGVVDVTSSHWWPGRWSARVRLVHGEIVEVYQNG